MVAFAAAARQLVATVATCYGINLRSSNATLRVIVSGDARRAARLRLPTGQYWRGLSALSVRVAQ